MLRKAILDLNDATSRYRMFKSFSKDEIQIFKEKSTLIKEKISRSSKFKTLSQKDREDILSCKKLFIYGLRDIIRKMGWEMPHFELFQAYISSHVHCHPVSFYRLPQQTEETHASSPANFALMALAMDFANGALSASINRFMEQFPKVGEGGIQSMIDRSPLNPKFIA